MLFRSPGTAAPEVSRTMPLTAALPSVVWPESNVDTASRAVMQKKVCRMKSFETKVYISREHRRNLGWADLVPVESASDPSIFTRLRRIFNESTTAGS